MPLSIQGASTRTSSLTSRTFAGSSATTRPFDEGKNVFPCQLGNLCARYVPDNQQSTVSARICAEENFLTHARKTSLNITPRVFCEREIHRTKTVYRKFPDTYLKSAIAKIVICSISILCNCLIIFEKTKRERNCDSSACVKDFEVSVGCNVKRLLHLAE